MISTKTNPKFLGNEPQRPKILKTYNFSCLSTPPCLPRSQSKKTKIKNDWASNYIWHCCHSMQF